MERLVNHKLLAEIQQSVLDVFEEYGLNHGEVVFVMREMNASLEIANDLNKEDILLNIRKEINRGNLK